jgi:hypothetical protein
MRDFTLHFRSAFQLFRPVDTEREGEMNRQAGEQMNGQTEGQMGRMIDRLTDKKTDTHINGKTDRQLDKLTNHQPGRWTGKGAILQHTWH